MQKYQLLTDCNNNYNTHFKFSYAGSEQLVDTATLTNTTAHITAFTALGTVVVTTQQLYTVTINGQQYYAITDALCDEICGNAKYLATAKTVNL